MTSFKPAIYTHIQAIKKLYPTWFACAQWSYAESRMADASVKDSLFIARSIQATEQRSYDAYVNDSRYG